VNDLAISSARRDHRSAQVESGGGGRQQGSSAKVPLQQRVCEWCSERLRQDDMGHMVDVGGAAVLPVEDEEHALLWCGLYAKERLQLFDAVRALTEVRGGGGEYVLAKGPVCLHSLTRSTSSTASSVAAALAVVLGGISGTSPGPLRRSDAQRRVDYEVQQAGKSFVGIPGEGRAGEEEMADGVGATAATRTAQGGA
jgi:hypothetical protein